MKLVLSCAENYFFYKNILPAKSGCASPEKSFVSFFVKNISSLILYQQI
jgi:hypothetical protein